jgi:hypothetical protein
MQTSPAFELPSQMSVARADSIVPTALTIQVSRHTIKFLSIDTFRVEQRRTGAANRLVFSLSPERSTT